MDQHRIHVSEIIYLLFLLSVILSEAVFWKKPCGVDGKYTICALEQEEICHPLNKSTELKIDKLEHSAIIVKPLSPIYHKQCRFTIRAKYKSAGLFAVIQNIKFRKNEEGCIDYVRFKTAYRGSWSEKWCGTMNRETTMDIPHNLYSDYDPMGNLETHIFISKQPIIPKDDLELLIVYTPNIRCSKVDRTNYRQVTSDICIWKEYICDDYQNCAIDGCDDQSECVRRLENSGTGTKVTVAAVTTIFISFILFVICLWVCKNHNILCWSSNCAAPGIARPNLNTDTEQVTTASATTAPMLEIAVPSSLQDKDLPPSYDSLFPQQSNTTTS